MKNTLAIAILVVAALLAGCDDPPLTLIYRVQDGTAGQGCGTSDCGQIQMLCRSVLHVRILDPIDPDVPKVSVCREVSPNNDMSLCAIGRIDLPVTSLPRGNYEIQVTVWPKDAVLVPGTSDTLDCLRTPVEFDAVYGFPVTASPTTEGPAFGGRAFYHPGDEETIVTLGCTNRDSINAPTCTGVNDLEVTSSVLDFDDLPLTVSEQVGERLTLSIGEPKPIEGGPDYALNSAAAKVLTQTVQGPIPAWAAGVELQLSSSACIQVTEDAAQTTTTVRCVSAKPEDRMLDIFGMRVARETVDEVLAALDLQDFPDAGLTLGIVIDQNNNPAPGAAITVDNPEATVEMINANRTGIAPGSTTTASGMFVSRDAVYGTFFGATLITPLQRQLGGRVNGKLTVVVFLAGDPIDP